MKKIYWKDIEDTEGKSTGVYTCQQNLRYMTYEGEPLTLKFIGQDYNKQQGTILDMCGETTDIKEVTPELESLLENNKFVVIEDYDGEEGELGTIIITKNSKYYPVDFVDYDPPSTQSNINQNNCCPCSCLLL